MFDELRLIPIFVGEATATEIAELLDLVWTDDRTLIVVSSDLSHFHKYEAAKLIDGETSRMIETCRAKELNNHRACGCRGISGLLAFANAHHLRVQAVELRNSGDTSGMKDQVVGNGGFVVY